MALTDIITQPGFYSGAFTVTRVALGTDDSNGRYIPGATTTFSIDANVQPVGSNLKVIPEGYTADDVRIVRTATALVKLPVPDLVTIAGIQYGVYRVDGPWSGFGCTFYNVYVARITHPGES